MAIQNTNSVIAYGSEHEGPVYPIPFRFLKDSDVKVSVLAPGADEPVDLVLGTGYTVVQHTDSNHVIVGGNVTTTTVYSDQHTIFVYRDVPLTQLTVLPEFGPFPANTLEMSLDKTVMALQQLERAQRRCFRTSPYGPELTPPYPQPNTVLGIAANLDLRMFTGAELLSLIQLPGSLTDAPTVYWLNDFDRMDKSPDFVGQLGLQMDDNSLWRSTGTDDGNWVMLALDEDDLGSDSDKQPPTQQSVRAYVSNERAEAQIHADNVANAAQSAAIAAANSFTTSAISTAVAGIVQTKTCAVFVPRDMQPPVANWARLSTRNSISTIRFSETVTEYAVFTGLMAQGPLYSSLQVIVHWASTATTGSVVWHANIERMNTNINADSWAAGFSGTTATQPTSGILAATTLTPNTDGLLPGEPFRLRVFRDASAPADTVAGDAEIIAIEVRRVP